MYIPERGDIFHLAFDPAAGTEMKGGHYAIALSQSLQPRNRLGLRLPDFTRQGGGGKKRRYDFHTARRGNGNTRQCPLPPDEGIGLENPPRRLPRNRPRLRD